MKKKSSSKKLASKKHKKEIKRKSKRKESKLYKEEAKRKLGAVERAISLFPKSCNICKSIFTGDDHSLDAWNLKVINDSMILTCEKCGNDN